uniref:Gamma-secretase-activating protein C-terminal domain-containing protein n=1 Tax=Neogobius melanostomus TaxID=47308 RepID=A0A8C6SPM0_9GOBI
MFRILEAVVGLCLPLPPGFHTLLAVFGVRCLPHHSFLLYLDQKLLQLTETFVARLMTGNIHKTYKHNPYLQTIYHMWDHPVMSASISRDYVHTLLEKRNKTKVRSSEKVSLILLLSNISIILLNSTNPFEEQENVDARFVEETALKQTLIQLGFEEK